MRPNSKGHDGHPPDGRPALHQAACASAIALAAGAAFPAAALGADALPFFAPRPDSWKGGIVANDGVVWDDDLAGWLADANAGAHDAVPGDWTLSIRATFTMCYGGAFLTAIDQALNGPAGPEPGLDFGANSASRYYEPCSADNAAVNSRYAHAWQNRAAAGFGGVGFSATDLAITTDAHLALRDGNMAGIPQNPRRHTEHPQFKGLAAGSPQDLHAGDHAFGCANFAILFAGDPEPRHKNNLTAMRDVLVNQYAWPPENIFILYGNFAAGTAPAAVNWTSSAKADVANLEKALTEEAAADGGWLLPRIAAYAAGADPVHELPDGTLVQLFLWVTDHGTVSAPLTMSVDPNTAGVAGTGVANRAANNGDQHEWIYEAGNGANSAEAHPQQGAMPMLMPGDVDALSFGYDAVFAVAPSALPGLPEDEQPAASKPGVYFSVTAASTGLANTDIDRKIGANLTPGGSVFVGSDGSNRRFVDAPQMGLLEGGNDADDLNALSLVPWSDIPAADRLVLISFAGSARIWVYDPWFPGNAVIPQGPRWYVFWDPATAPWPQDEDGQDDPTRPADIDALAANINVDPMWRYANPDDEDDPANGELAFKVGKDQFLFSVKTGDAMNASGCTIFRYTGCTVEEVYSCADLGLNAADDVDALHTYDDASPYRIRVSETQNDVMPEPACPGGGNDCPADLTGDGLVNVQDLVLVILDFGGGPGPADLSGDGHVDVIDLVLVILAWGPC
jgi:hypothetical protein